MVLSFFSSIRTPHSLIKTLSEDTCEPQQIQQVLSYLSTQASPPLELALQNCLTSEEINSVVMHLALQEPALMDTCLRVVKLDTLRVLANGTDVLAQAQQESLFLPKPATPSLSSKIVSSWLPQSTLVSKIVTYAASLITWTYSIDLDHPPKSYWMAQSQWSFLRNLLSDIQAIGPTLLTYFVTVKKSALAGATALGLMVGVKMLYQRYNYNTIPLLNTYYFHEMSPSNGHRSIGRLKETVEFLQKVCVPPNMEPNIPILIGPPGVGKTQFVEGIAVMIQKGEIPRLSGKRVFSINAESLTQHGKWSEGGEYTSRLETLFKEIKGKEAFVILFFDEIHNAAESQDRGMGGNVLESLKTKLLQENILCVLATTQEEYEKHIQPNKAFDDRIHPIKFKSADHQLTLQILQDQFLMQESYVEVTPQALEMVVKISDNIPHKSNPRKSIQLMKTAIGHVWSWIPTKLQQHKEQLTLEIQALRVKLTDLALTDPLWKDDKSIQQLESKMQQLKELEKTMEQQNTLHQQFIRLKTLQKTYQNRYFLLVHAKQPDEKQLFWLKCVVIPSLNQLVNNTLKEFQEKFHEEIPEKVTPLLVETLFSKKTINV